MMAAIMDKLNLKYSWRFELFGEIATDDDLRESLRKDMTLGILSASAKYMALYDMSLLDDLSLSNAIIASGIMEKRIPLASTYTGGGDANKSQGGEAKRIMNPGGRPTSGGKVTSEGQEADLDTYGE